MLQSHVHYLAAVGDVAEKALSADGLKEWRMHSDCSMDHKDTKLGWQLCDHSSKTPENPFLGERPCTWWRNNSRAHRLAARARTQSMDSLPPAEFSKALKDTTDTMALGDYIQSFHRVAKTADEDLTKVVEHKGDPRDVSTGAAGCGWVVAPHARAAWLQGGSSVDATPHH